MALDGAVVRGVAERCRRHFGDRGLKRKASGGNRRLSRRKTARGSRCGRARAGRPTFHDTVPFHSSLRPCAGRPAEGERFDGVRDRLRGDGGPGGEGAVARLRRDPERRLSFHRRSRPRNRLLPPEEDRRPTAAVPCEAGSGERASDLPGGSGERRTLRGAGHSQDGGNSRRAFEPPGTVGGLERGVAADGGEARLRRKPRGRAGAN